MNEHLNLNKEGGLLLRQNKGSIVLTVILGLAVIGLISFIGNSPGKFMLNILMIAVIGFVIFLILRAVMGRRTGDSGGEMKKYKQAVKQSKQKYNIQEEKPKQKSKKAAFGKSRKKRRNRPHLTVIDGKKGINNKEKKDRASN